MKKSVIATLNTTDLADDNIYDEPPPSPPPAHLIFLPETTHNAGTASAAATSNNNNNNNNNSSWQQSNNKQALDLKGYCYRADLRRRAFTLAKTLLRLIFKNNNLLLIMSLVNKLWKARAHFIRPVLPLIRHLAYAIKHPHSYQRLIRYSIHFMQYHFSRNFAAAKKHQHTISNSNSGTSSITTLVVLWATLGHLLSLFRRTGSRWASKTINSMGGLDSVLLAISTLALTRAVRPERIF